MLRGEIFLPGGEEEWFWQFEPFSKLKTAFCEYWTSDKIKISVTCVSKEYEVKAKMVQEQWLQLKMTLLLGYNLKNFIQLGEGNQLLVEREWNLVEGSLLGGIFRSEGGWRIFGWWAPHPHQYGKSWKMLDSLKDCYNCFLPSLVKKHLNEHIIY